MILEIYNEFQVVTFDLYLFAFIFQTFINIHGLYKNTTRLGILQITAINYKICSFINFVIIFNSRRKFYVICASDNGNKENKFKYIYNKNVITFK